VPDFILNYYTPMRSLSTQFNANGDWIKTGQGEMFRADKSSLDL